MRRLCNMQVLACLCSATLLLGCEQNASDPAASAEKTSKTEATVKPAALSAKSEEAPQAEVTRKTAAKAAMKDAALEKGDLKAKRLTDEESTKVAALAQERQAEAERAATLRYTEHVVVAEPAELDLGEMATNDAGTGTVRLVNHGEEAMKLNNCKSSCGCTAPSCPKGTMIAPGDAIEIEIKMSSGAVPARMNKTVTFDIDGQPPLLVPVTAQVISFVEAEPVSLNRDTTERGEVTLRATDGQPFTITRMQPPVITEFPSEPATEHHVTIDWDVWDQVGRNQRMLMFFTDHPKCNSIRVSVVNATIPQQLADGGAAKMQAAVDSMRPEVLISTGKSNDLIKQLEEGKIQSTYHDHKGNPLLHIAAEAGDVTVIEYLLEKGADIESLDSLKRTPLLASAKSKNPEAIRTLLDAGAKLDATNHPVGGALAWAAGFGDPASVKLLLEAHRSEGNLEEQLETPSPITGYTPIIWAAIVGDPQSVQALVDAGADVEVRDTIEGMTPIMHAARTGQTATIKVLIEGHSNLSATNSEGKTPLLVAASASGADVSTVQTLVEAGSDVNAVESRKLNALELAEKRTDIRAKGVAEYLRTVMNADGDSEAAAADAGENAVGG